MLAGMEQAPFKIETSVAGVSHLQLCRPERLNALNEALVDELNVMNRYRTDHTMGRVDALLSTVASVQGQLGATGNRLESAIATLTSGTTNLSEARSRIADTDYSDESVKLARAQILAQASTAMLAQANQSQKDVLKLLGQ